MCMSLILQKRAGKRVPSPLLVVINNQKNKIKTPSHMVNPWLVINKGEEECYRSSMGAALKFYLTWVVVHCLLPFGDMNMHLSKLFLHLYVFKNKKL